MAGWLAGRRRAEEEVQAKCCESDGVEGDEPREVDWEERVHHERDVGTVSLMDLSGRICRLGRR